MILRCFPFFLVAAVKLCSGLPQGHSVRARQLTEFNKPSAHRPAQFDVELLQAVSRLHEGNIALSPISVKVLLAMLMEGSSGPTSEEIQFALRLPAEPPGARDIVHSWVQAFEEKPKRTKLSLATRLFLMNNHAPNRAFANVLKEKFHGGLQSLPVDSTKAASEVNDWISKETNGIIQNMITRDQLSSEAHALLASAVYFKAPWKIPFERVPSRCFRKADGGCVDTWFMQRTGTFKYGYIGLLDAKAIEIPYLVGSLLYLSAFGIVCFLKSEINMIQTQAIKAARSLPSIFRRNIGVAAPFLQKASDPIQQLFLDKIKEYKQKSSGGKLVEPTKELERELNADLGKALKQFGGAPGVDMTKFPTVEFSEDERFSMLIFLPQGNIKQLEKDITIEPFHRALFKLQPQEVQVQLPKFSLDFKQDLVEALRRVDISKAFSADANFSRILESANDTISISNVFHSARIVVNEEGSEAAAATVAEIVPLMGQHLQKFTADKPFFFFIRDTINNVTLFAGRVSDPERAMADFMKEESEDYDEFPVRTQPNPDTDHSIQELIHSAVMPTKQEQRPYEPQAPGKPTDERLSGHGAFSAPVNQRQPETHESSTTAKPVIRTQAPPLNRRPEKPSTVNGLRVGTTNKSKNTENSQFHFTSSSLDRSVGKKNDIIGMNKREPGKTRRSSSSSSSFNGSIYAFVS